jgi:hypothetical protein
MKGCVDCDKRRKKIEKNDVEFDFLWKILLLSSALTIIVFAAGFILYNAALIGRHSEFFKGYVLFGLLLAFIGIMGFFYLGVWGTKEHIRLTKEFKMR